jgi:hypothetical protein
MEEGERGEEGRGKKTDQVYDLHILRFGFDF